MDNATAPDLGTGPWGVEQEGNLFWLTLNGTRAPGRTPILNAKSAYRACRKYNGEATADERETAETYLEDEGVKVSKSNPKSGKGTSKSNPPERKSSKKTTAKAQPAPKSSPKAKSEPTPAAKKGKAGHSTVVFQGTREEWLNAFVAAARPIFKEAGHELPEKIRISVGFMFRGKKNTIGQCWHEEASTDGTREIFIIPTLDDSSRIADVLTHELCHTLFGPDEKHGRNFKAAVTDLGLEGKATATVAGEKWEAWAKPILDKLGPIPHAALDPKSGARIKQNTYLVKCECDVCGLVGRLTAKWINAAEDGLSCPDTRCDGTWVVEVPDEG